MEFEYDVAFSFTSRDEELAFQINDLIQDRYKTFIYSEQQKNLAGTDGEIRFNEVFAEKSRLVVILFREDWGKTSWTRIEENAIRSRGHDEGYDFTTFIKLDKNSQMPKWLPKNRIYFDFERWGFKGLAPVIEARINDAGGISKPDSISDHADRLKRHRALSLKREQLFLNRSELFNSANKEADLIFDLLKESKSVIEDPKSGLYLAFSMKEQYHYEFGYKGYYLHFNWGGQYAHDIRSAPLQATIYEKNEFVSHNNEANILRQSRYQIDYDILCNIGWSDYDTNNNFIKSADLVDKWVKLFIMGVGKRK